MDRFPDIPDTYIKRLFRSQNATISFAVKCDHLIHWNCEFCISISGLGSQQLKVFLTALLSDSQHEFLPLFHLCPYNKMRGLLCGAMVGLMNNSSYKI